ncbi:MAG: ATP phosphoribosyltransferase regulatory subunit [Pseudomonadota bacterium]
MTDQSQKALLPAGLRDVLPPDAAAEARVMETLMASFAAHGYARVSPPLVEFEETLLEEAGAGMANKTFRVMDPVSQRMMGVRPDMTLQVARIARTRLLDAPRPLRLCYGGQVLRVVGSQLRPEREFAQAGVELIGSAAVNADLEVIQLAVEALQGIGVANLSIDLNLPIVVPAVCEDLGLECGRGSPLRDMLDHKDVTAVTALGGKPAKVLGALLAATGPVDRALGLLQKIALPKPAAAERARLVEVAERLADLSPDVGMTVDAVENRGFEYQSGLSFTFFALDVRGSLGRGGRYAAGEKEPATGFTLFLDSVQRALSPAPPSGSLYLSFGTSAVEGARLRQEGRVTVAALEDGGDPQAEAKRLGCTHFYVAGKVMPVKKS